MQLLGYPRCLSATVMLSLLLTFGPPISSVGANGQPVKIVLSYLVGVSTWGPNNATGVAELVAKEGEVRLTATGLQPLQNEQYVLWVINTVSGERMTLGSFKAGEGGVAKLDLVLKDAVPDKSWDLMLVSVEADGSQPTEPGARRSIAGRFPPPPGSASEAKPGLLPNTGGNESGVTPGLGISWGAIAGVAVLGVALSGIVGFRVGRLTAKKGPR